MRRFSLLFFGVVLLIGLQLVWADEKRRSERYSRSLTETSVNFSISEAVWEAGDSLLVVKGKAPKRAAVDIVDAQTQTLIARLTANREGRWRLKKRLSAPPCAIKAVSAGVSLEKSVQNAGSCSDAGTGTDTGTVTDTGTGTGVVLSGDYVSLAVNDLGMHCADLDYQVFSILPPYNVLHGQVIKKGKTPELMDNSQVELYYRAARNPADGIPPDAITTTSSNVDGYFKSNFWDAAQTGRVAYDPLYPEGVLDSFDLPVDRGLPAPDVEKLYLGDGALAAHQQEMPGTDNVPQLFHGYINDFPFFTQTPFGYVAEGLNRHTAEGIPILPAADPQGNPPVVYESAYPLMQVTAVAKGNDPANADNHLSSVRAVVPVASEADCQMCHADQDVCNTSQATMGMECSGVASTGADTWFEVVSAEDINAGNVVPGSTPQQIVINAAKINILRLHDAKHATTLDQTRNVVCASCHYSPALDLAQLGPNDDNGKEQTQHISMSRAMHGHHGEYTDLFPDMPSPVGRNMLDAQKILGETCYACHPGKRTQCLRGAMTKSNIVCQDCHGNMQQVGNDFTKTPHSLSWDLRVPWANEPGCQSCHTGDAVDNMAANGDVIAAGDGIRLLQAFRKNDADATPIVASNRRFAETQDSQGNNHLYRLSKGHGGVMCEGCHGSTHAIWPNPRDAAADNLASKDLQGHSGTLTECSVCHADADLGLTLDGPHGMHPVGSSNWNKNHEDVAERNASQCKSCHGKNGEGTVLSRTATERSWTCGDRGTLCAREDQQISVARGTEVSCTQCHENKI